MEDLLALAVARGLRVVWCDLGRRNGEYRASGLIVLNPRRPGQTQRVTLAHELGHARYGHVWSEDPRVRERQEAWNAELAARSDRDPSKEADYRVLARRHLRQVHGVVSVVRP